MTVVAIIGSGPKTYLPNLKAYEAEVDIWIGADLGAIRVLDYGMSLDYAVGDFDSVTKEEKKLILEEALHTDEYSEAKNATDLELAMHKAYEMNANKIYLFGITGGRLDHALINIQLLHTIVNKNIRGIIVDAWNKIELKKPGNHVVLKNKLYKYISFIPFTEIVKRVNLTDFLYPLENFDITWGSTRLISNELQLDKGSFSFEEGLLLLVQSRDMN